MYKAINTPPLDHKLLFMPQKYISSFLFSAYISLLDSNIEALCPPSNDALFDILTNILNNLKMF